MRLDPGTGGLEPLRLRPLHAKAVELPDQRLLVRRDQVDQVALLGGCGGDVGRLADHLLGQVRVTAVSLGEGAHERGRVVSDLAAEHLVLLAAAERDRRRRADVRLRRHRRHVGRLGDVEARGRGPRAVRRHVDDHRHRRGDDLLDHLAHRVIEAAGRVEPEDHDARPCRAWRPSEPA